MRNTEPLGWLKISVVTANLNQGAFLDETIDSVLSQGYPNLEYIIIDGGSTDGSQEVIARYASRLAFHCSEPDAGHYDAVNKGFARATGDILAFLNADDKYFPCALRTVGEVFAAYADVHWLTSLLPAAWDVAGHCIDVTPQRGYSREAFFDGYYGGGGSLSPPGIIQQESTFWRRSLWDAAGGRLRTEVSHAADFDLWARSLRARGTLRPTGGAGRISAARRAAVAGGQPVRRTNRRCPGPGDAARRAASVLARLHPPRRVGWPAPGRQAVAEGVRIPG